VVRLRSLNARPFGGCGSVVGSPFFRVHQRQSSTRVVPVPVVRVRVVLAWYDRPWCGTLGMQVWFERPWCGAPVVPRVIACSG